MKYPLIILAFALLLIVSAVTVDGALSKARFMQGCTQDMKEYECLLMWRSQR